MSPVTPPGCSSTGARTARSGEKAPPPAVKEFYRQALVHYSQGEIEKARDLFKEVLRHDGAHAAARNALGRIEEELSPR